MERKVWFYREKSRKLRSAFEAVRCDLFANCKRKFSPNHVAPKPDFIF